MNGAASSEDVLSQILGNLDLRGEIFCRTRLGDRTCLSFPPGQTHFHVIEKGSCWVSVADEDRILVASSGDLLLLISGRGHSLATSPSQALNHELMDIVPTHYDAERLCLDVGDGEPRVEMICGRFSMDSVAGEALIGALPTVLHLQAHQEPLRTRLALTLQMLSDEVTVERPGSALVRSRLVDLVLVEALRRWLDESGEETLGWLTALRDPVVGRALHLIHGMSERPWTVTELAASVGMSRSPFAARFKNHVGKSPIQYLISWRMRSAVRLLKRGQTVGEVARAVSYESEAAFSRVFKREIGVPPSKLRPKADR